MEDEEFIRSEGLKITLAELYEYYRGVGVFIPFFHPDIVKIESRNLFFHDGIIVVQHESE
jgi:hypothetical protein